jgi:hypothetical protein
MLEGDCVMRKLYKRVKLTDEQEDEFVFPHKMAMTGEKLHYKSEIAYELGTRDKRIAELEAVAEDLISNSSFAINFPLEHDNLEKLRGK